MTVKIPFKDLLPSPFRNVKKYKIDEAKIESLTDSYRSSGYWPIIIARKNKEGRYERAYGEHRAQTFERLYGKDAEIEIIVMELSDDMMIKMMANENNPAYRSPFIHDIVTVEAAVEKNGHTAASICKYLGWNRGGYKHRVENALAALEYIKSGRLTITQFSDLGNKAAETLIQETRVADARATETEKALQYQIDEAQRTGGKEAAARKKAEIDKTVTRIRTEIPEKVSAALKSKEVQTRNARRLTDEITKDIHGDNQPLPFFDDVIVGLCREIADFIDPLFAGKRARKIAEILEVQKDVRQIHIAHLKECLEGLSERCLRLANRIKVDTHRAIPHPTKKALTK
jgi:ParB-like chromosome segregation protein Spo0J